MRKARKTFGVTFTFGSLLSLSSKRERGGRIGMKQRSKQHLRKKNMDSEYSDEDYVAEADEIDEQSDDLDSLAGDASEEKSCFEGEEEEDFDALDGREGDWRTAVKPKPKSRVQKGFSRSRKNGVSRTNGPKKRKVTHNNDDDSVDDDDDGDDEFTLDDFEYLMKEEEADYDEEDGRQGEWRTVVKPKPKPNLKVHKGFARSRKNGVNRPKKRRKVTRNNDDDSDDDGDNEYTPDEFEYLMEEGEEEEEEEEANYEEDASESEWRTVVRPKPKPNSRVQKGFSRSRKKRRKVTRKHCDDSEDDDDTEFTPDESEYLMEEEKANYEEDDGSETVVKPKPKPKSRVQKGFSRSRKNGVNKPKKRRKVKRDDEDDYDDDDEFTPGECEYLDEEEDEEIVEEGEEEDDDDSDDDFPKAKITKRGRATLRRKKSFKSQSKRTAKTVRKPSKTRSKRTSSSRKKAKSGGDEQFIKKGPTLRGRTKRNPGQRKKRVTAGFDSDICSDSSDCEFTISEEEREQFKEASLFCRTVVTNLRSSRRFQEDESFCEPKIPPARKGKEKTGETKNEKVNSVCGICLTEEAKSTVHGTLNCCSHYFCFACIMEWSKVETRCPLCKQRFVTISKPTKCGKGFDLRNAVVTVPERDQVYQPSEEELRDFLNPYENVICTECHEGGDDALMLLCDVCDSPAHTYCVGLGREVPEGNWYCDGCRPAVLASLHSQTQDFMPDQRAGADASDGLSTYENMAEIDLNVTIPETPLLSQGDGFISSPRYSGGSLQVPSPVSGIGVSTVSGRRRLHRQIQNILSNRMSQTGGEIRSLGNMIGLGVNTTLHHRRLDVGTSHHAQQVGRFQESYYDSVQNTDFGPVRLGNMMGHVGQPLTAADCSAHSHRARNELNCINLEMTQAQLSASDPHQPCTSRSSIGPDAGGFSSENREEEHTNFVKQEIHFTVRNQLQSMSREMNLGHNTYMEISRRSEHTVMAAYGLEPRRHNTYQVRPPVCDHLLDRLANVESSPLNGCCLDCFQDFVKVVVKRIMDIMMAPYWQDFRH